MRGLLVGATISLAFIVGVVGASAAHAEGPSTSEESSRPNWRWPRSPCQPPQRQVRLSLQGLPGGTPDLCSFFASSPAGKLKRCRLLVVTTTPAAERRIAEVIKTAAGTAPALLVAYLMTAGRLDHAGALGEVWRTADGEASVLHS